MPTIQPIKTDNMDNNPTIHTMDPLNILPTFPAQVTQESNTSIINTTNDHNEDLKCHLCQKSFTKKSNLIQHHKGVHGKNKPFRCQMCHKYFTQKHSLKNHLLIHIDSKPYNCPHCNKKFRVKYNLKLHLRQHS